MNNNSRKYSSIDKAISQIDETVKLFFGNPQRRYTARPCPGSEEKEAKLTDGEKRHIAGLMRINHSGEIAAQGLYQGQALTAQLPEVREQMQQAAEEEYDHLDWCKQRLTEMSSHPSVLQPLWYSGAFAIGTIAGLIGDQWSLGFVAETERQVTAHLDQHLQKLPEQDKKSRAILQQMREDEAQHAICATAAGGKELPPFIRWLMRVKAKIMTKTAYRI